MTVKKANRVFEFLKQQKYPGSFWAIYFEMSCVVEYSPTWTVRFWTGDPSQCVEANGGSLEMAMARVMAQIDAGIDLGDIDIDIDTAVAELSEMPDQAREHPRLSDADSARLAELCDAERQRLLAPLEAGAAAMAEEVQRHSPRRRIR